MTVIPPNNVDPKAVPFWVRNRGSGALSVRGVYSASAADSTELMRPPRAELARAAVE